MRATIEKLEKWIFLGLVLALSACGSGDEYDGFDASIDGSTPNGFLTFFNRQGDLAAGAYTLIAATAANNQAGDFRLLIRYHDGRPAQVIDGSWIASGGADPDPACASGNRCYPVSLNDASGASFELTSSVDSLLYLVDDSDTPRVVASADDAGAAATERLVFSRSDIDETDFASAYYAAVDPASARATAQAYIALHGLDNPDVHVIFRDAKDLGYGRDMYMVAYDNAAAGSSCGPAGAVTIAFFVRNFSVEIVEGFAYGPVNLEAAIAGDLQHHVGSNAIEFGYGRDDVGDTCSAEPMTRFFTYQPVYNPPGALHPRRTRVDLDARGDKAMPQPCISCHGGKLLPLDRNGDFVGMHAQDSAARFGDTKARLQAFEVDSFGFSSEPGYRRADYEEGLRLLNAAVYCSYPGSAGHPACAAFGNGVAAQADEGEWSGDFAREMMLGWYGNALETAGSAFDESFVPAGWTPSAGGPPVGADRLFTKVIGPNCFVCHGKRGTELGSNDDPLDVGKDIDFSSWDKFISYADEIERLVFDEGKMPMGLLNYENFWNDPEKAELLASFIAPRVRNSAGFEARRTDGAGGIIEPGRALARAGPDRVTLPNATITLNAQASLFADTYRWRITSMPAGASASLSRPSAMRTDFVADTVGEYMVSLSASSAAGGSGSDSLTITLDNSLAKAPRDLTFYTDISARLDTCATTCHSAGGGTTGGDAASVAVWWSEAQPFAVPPAATPALGRYEQVLARVNLEYIEQSLLLKKPSNQHHFGGLRTGFDTARAVGTLDRRDYDLFVNWIAEGAACGGSAAQCAQ